jgi:hypothetical protein
MRDLMGCFLSRYEVQGFIAGRFVRRQLQNALMWCIIPLRLQLLRRATGHVFDAVLSYHQKFVFMEMKTQCIARWQ